jgi:lipopolysaccharide export LptBFGC system permease protein LptF
MIVILIASGVSLATKDLADTSDLEFARHLARFLTVPTVALLILYLFMVFLRVNKLLS